jgi:hypothetical protein
MSGSKFLDGNTMYMYVQLVFFMSGSKRLDWTTLYLQIVSILKTSWTYMYMVFPSKNLEPDMKNRKFEHTRWFHPKVLNQTWVFFMSGSKRLDWTTLYLQIVSILCLVQHCWLIFARPKIFVLKSNKRNIYRKKVLF